MTYPNQDGPTQPFTTVCGSPFERVYIHPPGATDLNYRRFRMQVPNNPQGPAVFFFHGRDGHEDSIDKLAFRKMADTWIDQGWIVVSPKSRRPISPFPAWGNQESLDGMVTIWGWLTSVFNPTGVVGYGTSMGSLVGFNVLVDNRLPMFGHAVSSGVCDLEAIYYAGHQTTIRAAYNFLTDAEFPAATAGHNPITRPRADFRNLPVRFYASDNDTQVVRSAHTDPMAVRLAGHVAELEVINCQGSHGSDDHVRDADVLTFFQRASGVC